MVETKKGKDPGRVSTGGLNRPLKKVKMVQARCNICNPRGQGRQGWWDTCPHDPYFHVEEKPGTTQFKELEDGTIVKLDKPEAEYVKVPNWKQIADEPKVASGRMVQIQRERGSKFPQDLGYAPICDYNNCWETNPKVHAQKVVSVEGASVVVGNYHTRDEAAIMTLRLNQTPIFIGVDEDIARRRAQLDAVNVL